MMMYDRDTLLNELRSNVVEVLFTKVNGEQRNMICTLKPNYLPRDYIKEEDESFHQKNSDTIIVWDVQNNGWRSFKINSVTYAQGVSGYD
jgi:hypothetical protein